MCLERRDLTHGILLLYCNLHQIYGLHIILHVVSAHKPCRILTFPPRYIGSLHIMNPEQWIIWVVSDSEPIFWGCCFDPPDSRPIMWLAGMQEGCMGPENGAFTVLVPFWPSKNVRPLSSIVPQPAFSGRPPWRRQAIGWHVPLSPVQTPNLQFSLAIVPGTSPEFGKSASLTPAGGKRCGRGAWLFDGGI